MLMPLAVGNSCWVRVWVQRHWNRDKNHNSHYFCNWFSAPETGFPLYHFNENFWSTNLSVLREATRWLL